MGFLTSAVSLAGKLPQGTRGLAVVVGLFEMYWVLASAVSLAGKLPQGARGLVGVVGLCERCWVLGGGKLLEGMTRWFMWELAYKRFGPHRT